MSVPETQTLYGFETRDVDKRRALPGEDALATKMQLLTSQSDPAKHTPSLLPCMPTITKESRKEAPCIERHRNVRSDGEAWRRASRRRVVRDP